MLRGALDHVFDAIARNASQAQYRCDEGVAMAAGSRILAELWGLPGVLGEDCNEIVHQIIPNSLARSPPF